MNKMLKKAMCMTLALTMCVSALAGCGGNGDSSETSSTSSKADTSSVASTAGSDSSEVSTSERTETVSLELVSGDGVTIPEDSENFIKEAIKEALNIDVTFNIIGAGADYTTALNARVAGGDAPDLFVSPGKDVTKQYGQNGIIMDLAPYLDQLQPVVDWVGGEENVNPSYVDGKLYYIPKKGGRDYNIWNVRKDWLEAVGATTPTTVDEALEVAKKLTFDDPDGNGKDDTYGFSGHGLVAFNAIMGAYGTSVEHKVIIEDGKVTSTLLKPGMKDGLEMCKQWVDAGVVDPDIVANSWDATRDKMIQGQTGMTSYSWSDLYKNTYQEQIKAVNENAEWTWFDPLQSEVGEEAYWGYDSGTASMGKWVVNAEIEKDPVKLQAVIDLLNYIVSDEGSRLFSFGIEGRHYNLLEDGTVEATELMGEECGFLWVYQICFRDETSYLKTKFPEASDVIEFSQNMKRGVYYNDAVDVSEDFHMEDMYKYISDNMISFIYGQRPISEYDDFIEELNTSFGFSDYLAEAETQLTEKGYVG